MKTATRTLHLDGRERTRRTALRAKGHSAGPITRLMSPGDLGELVKPFVFLDYFEFFGGGGGPVHPHSGIATHTTPISGSVFYADSTDKTGVLSAGSVEWMQAGGGAWHGGNALPGEPLRGFQLWVALPREIELAPAQSHYIGRDAVPGDSYVRVLLGAYREMRSPIPYPAPITYLHVRLKDGERWSYQPPPGRDVAWLAVANGALRIDDVELRREMAIFEDGGGRIDILARGAADLVIGSALKHPHPLVLGDYSVHSSEETLALGEAGIERVASTMKLRPGEILRGP